MEQFSYNVAYEKQEFNVISFFLLKALEFSHPYRLREKLPCCSHIEDVRKIS